METPAPATTAAAPTDAASYVAKAGAGDMWEIESSKALRAKSQRDDVKAFAQMMIDNHGESTAKVKAAADAASITVPPPALDPEQQRMLDEIKARSEEHTSELQSLMRNSYAVFCLKKKT